MNWKGWGRERVPIERIAIGSNLVVDLKKEPKMKLNCLLWGEDVVTDWVKLFVFITELEPGGERDSYQKSWLPQSWPMIQPRMTSYLLCLLATKIFGLFVLSINGSGHWLIDSFPFTFILSNYITQAFPLIKLPLEAVLLTPCGTFHRKGFDLFMLKVVSGNCSRAGVGWILKSWGNINDTEENNPTIQLETNFLDDI